MAMCEGVFLRLSDKFALGADDLQWILYRGRHKQIAAGAPLKQRDWDAISFVSSTKDILHRCREKGCIPSAEALSVLAGYPSTFKAWKAAQPACNKPQEQPALEEALG